MSVNITVNGKFSKHCGKSSLLEDPERKKKELLEERKKQRILQVRTESKNIAQKIRCDVAKQRERLQKDFDQQCAQEQERLQRQMIAQAHRDYRSAIFQVGSAHHAADIENQRKATTSTAAAAAKKQTYKEFKRQQSQSAKIPKSYKHQAGKRSCLKDAQPGAPSTSASKGYETAKIHITQKEPRCNCCPCNDEDESSSDLLEDSCEISCTESVSDEEPNCNDECEFPVVSKKATQTKGTILCKTPAVILDVDVGLNDVVTIMSPAEIKDSHTENNRQFSHVIRVSPERRYGDRTDKIYNPNNELPSDPTPSGTSCETTDLIVQKPNRSGRNPRFTQISDLIERKKGQSTKFDKPVDAAKSPSRRPTQYHADQLPSKQTATVPATSPRKEKLPVRPLPQIKKEPASKSPSRQKSSAPPSSLVRKPASKSPGPSSPTRKSAPKSPSLSSPTRKTLEKSSNSTSPTRKQAASKSPAAKSPSPSKSKKNMSNRNKDLVLRKSEDNLSLQKPCSITTIGTDSNSGSGSGQVQFYDYNNKYKKAYPQPVTAVHILPPDRAQPNAMDQARIERQLQCAREKEIERMKKKSEERGQKALEREQVRRDCEELTEKLDALTKQHAPTMQPNNGHMIFGTGAARKEAKMNTAIEEILMRPAIITCPEITRPMQQPYKPPTIYRSQDSCSLNLGAPPTAIELDNSTPSSESCRSILLGYVNDQSKQIRDDLNQYEANPQKHQEKAKRLKCLLKRINNLRDALLSELNAGGTQNETKNIQQMIDSLCDLRQEREIIIIDDTTEPQEQAPRARKSTETILNENDSELIATQPPTHSRSRERKLKTKREEPPNSQLYEREQILKEKEAILENKLREFFELQKNCSEPTKQPTNTDDGDGVGDVHKATVLVGDKPLEIVVNVQCGNGKKSKLKTAKTPRKESKIIQSPNAIKKKKSYTNLAKQKQRAAHGSSSYDSHSTSYRSLPPPKITKNDDENLQQPAKELTIAKSKKDLTRPPPANVSPLLAQYIQRMLSMSRNSVNALGVSSSDFDTASSSVINTAANLSNTSASEGLSAERLERVQNFIADNHSFVNELEDSLKTTTARCLEDCINETLDKIWKQRFRERETRSKPQHKAAKDTVAKRVDGERKKAGPPTDPRTKDESQAKSLMHPNQADSLTTEKTSKVQRSADSIRPEKPKTQESNCDKRREELAKQIASFIQSLVDPTKTDCEDTGITPKEQKSIDMEINQKRDIPLSTEQTSRIPAAITIDESIAIDRTGKTLKSQKSSDDIIVIDDSVDYSDKSSKVQKSIAITDKANKSNADQSGSANLLSHSTLNSILSSFCKSFIRDGSKNQTDVLSQPSTKKVEKSASIVGQKSRDSSQASRNKTQLDQSGSRNVQMASDPELITETTTLTVEQQHTRTKNRDKGVATDHSHQAEGDSQIQRYAQLTENCNQRISGLTDLINKIREEKQKILEKTLSSVSDNECHSTEHNDLPQITEQQCQDQLSTSKTPKEKMAIETVPSSTEISQGETFPLEKHRPISGSRDSGISISRPVTALSDMEPQSTASSKTGQKHKPLPCISQYNPQLLEDGVVHELSTILEQDTPRTSHTTLVDRRTHTQRSTGSVSQIVLPTCDEYAKMLDLDLSIVDTEERIRIQKEYKLLKEAVIETDLAQSNYAFPIFEEYARALNLSPARVDQCGLTDGECFPTFQEYAKKSNLNLSALNPNQTALIREEYMELFEAYVKGKVAGGTEAVAFPTFEEYAKMLSLNLTMMSSVEEQHVREEYQSIMESLNKSKTENSEEAPPFPTFEEYAKRLNLDLTLLEPNQIEVIQKEHAEKYAAYFKSKINNSTAAVAFPTFEEYAKILDLNLTDICPKIEQEVQQEYAALIEGLKEAKLLKEAQHVKEADQFPTFEQYAKHLCLDLTMLNQNQTAVIREEYKDLFEAYVKGKVTGDSDAVAFPTFEEYAKMLDLNLTTIHPEECAGLQKEYNSFNKTLNEVKTLKLVIQDFPTFEEYAIKLNFDLTKMDPKQIPQIRKQHKELFGAYIKAKTKGTSLPTPIMTFAEYVNKTSLDLTQKTPEQVACIKKGYYDFLANIAENETKLRVPRIRINNADENIPSSSNTSPAVAGNLIEFMGLRNMMTRSKNKITSNTPCDTDSLENASSTASSDSESIVQIERELMRRNILRIPFIVPVEQDNVFSSTGRNNEQNMTGFQHMLLGESGLERISTSDSRSGGFERELLSVGIPMPALMRNKRKETEALSSTTTTSTAADANPTSTTRKVTYAQSKQPSNEKIHQKSSTEQSIRGSDDCGNKKLDLRAFLAKELQKHATTSSSSSAGGSTVDELLKKQFFQSIIGSITSSASDSPRPGNRPKTSTPNRSEDTSTSSQIFSGESHLSSVRFQKQTTTHYYPKAKDSELSVDAEDSKDVDANSKATKQRYIPKPKKAARRNLGNDEQGNDEINTQPSTSAQMQHLQVPNKDDAHNFKRS